MKTKFQWVIVRIDGKIAAISADYAQFAAVAAALAKKTGVAYEHISCDRVSFEEVWEIQKTAVWEDFLLFGTPFQKKVWQKLFELTHGEERPHLISYSDFAGLCDNRAGVRAVAHAISLNPVLVVIPCHLVVPKETIDKIREIHRQQESTIFKNEGVYLFDSLAYGEYVLGKEMKKKLIVQELAR